jgi:hypothetical protein
MVSINPLYPPILGDFLKLGGTPRPPAGIILHLFQRHLSELPPAGWGAPVGRILAHLSLEFALQRLEPLLATPPEIHPVSKLTGILADLYIQIVLLLTYIADALTYYSERVTIYHYKI